MGLKLPFPLQCKLAGLPEPEPEYRFAPPRRWRFDWCFPAQRVAVEQEGGAWLPGGGRHTRGKGYVADMEKYREAAIMGWCVLRFTPQQIASGAAVAAVKRAMEGHRNNGRFDA